MKKRAKSKETAQTRRESFEQINTARMYIHVLNAIGKDVLTAREVAERLCAAGVIDYPARAIIQPRLTELVERGTLEIVGKKYDDITKRHVAQYERTNHVQQRLF